MRCFCGRSATAPEVGRRRLVPPFRRRGLGPSGSLIAPESGRRIGSSGGRAGAESGPSFGAASCTPSGPRRGLSWTLVPSDVVDPCFALVVPSRDIVGSIAKPYGMGPRGPATRSVGSSRNPGSLTHGSVSTRQTALAMPATGDVEREPATARPKRLTTSTKISAPPSVHRHRGSVSPSALSLLTAPGGAGGGPRQVAPGGARTHTLGVRKWPSARRHRGHESPKAVAPGGATGVPAAHRKLRRRVTGSSTRGADLGSETTSRVGRGPERLVTETLPRRRPTSGTFASSPTGTPLPTSRPIDRSGEGLRCGRPALDRAFTASRPPLCRRPPAPRRHPSTGRDARPDRPRRSTWSRCPRSPARRCPGHAPRHASTRRCARRAR